MIPITFSLLTSFSVGKLWRRFSNIMNKTRMPLSHVAYNMVSKVPTRMVKGEEIQSIRIRKEETKLSYGHISVSYIETQPKNNKLL